MLNCKVKFRKDKERPVTQCYNCSNMAMLHLIVACHIAASSVVIHMVLENVVSLPRELLCLNLVHTLRLLSLFTYAVAARSSCVTVQATKPVDSSVTVSAASNRVVNLPSTGGSSVSGIFEICERAFGTDFLGVIERVRAYAPEFRRLLAEGNDSSAVLVCRLPIVMLFRFPYLGLML